MLVHCHKRPVNQKNTQEQNSKTGQRKGGFIELLRREAKKSSSSDQQKWEDLAEEVDGAELTALLDEEWEKLSSEQKEKCGQRASKQKKKWKNLSSEQKKDATKKAVEKLKEKQREMAEIKAAEKKAADKKVWADYEKERAKEGRENAEEGCFASRKHQFMNTKSDAFKNMARAARISAEPQKG